MHVNCGPYTDLRALANNVSGGDILHVTQAQQSGQELLTFLSGPATRDAALREKVLARLDELMAYADHADASRV